LSTAAAWSTAMKKYDKYIKLAQNKGMIDALIISPTDICFDIRTQLKCAWGCDRNFTPNAKCDNRDTTYEERLEMVKQYSAILLMHSHDVQKLSKVILELEKAAFLDGYYFAFALRSCNLCEVCQAIKENDCIQPEKIRPCESMFGIDIFKTVHKLGLPIEVLQNKEAVQNRYGFLLIE
jgi:predicted metal-binding protein